jgi:DNA-directed RNA polymerase subunit beta'
LHGLKENVIVGRLIPAGTGAYVNQLKKLAAGRDKLAIAAQQQAGALEQAEEAAVEVPLAEAANS